MTDPTLEELEKLAVEATQGPWNMWCGQGWPREWCDLRPDFPADQEIVWPIAPRDRNTDREPAGVFLSAKDQRYTWKLLNAAPALISAARRAEKLEQENAQLRRWLAEAESDRDACGEKLRRMESENDRMRRALHEIRAHGDCTRGILIWCGVGLGAANAD